jgi:hypothetical protein
MLLPGALMVVPVPMLAKSATAPVAVCAVTAMTPIQLLGWVMVLAPSLPVDTTTTLPMARTAVMAAW